MDKKGTVVNQNDRTRSYDILKKRGNILARNRRHLIPTTENLTSNKITAMPYQSATHIIIHI